MPEWKPEPIWQNQDVTIIGGGASLQTFSFEVLVNENVIGCNAAYRLGKDICSVVFFGDNTFLDDHEKGLEQYGGPVFTCARRCVGSEIPWLRWVRRTVEGLAVDAIGWNGTTGGAAINLAFLFGCKRVFLLGFDMCEREGKSHWHDAYGPKKVEQDYPKFARGFEYVVRDWKELCSDREVINVNDNSSLKCFPCISMEEYLKGRLQ